MSKKVIRKTLTIGLVAAGFTILSALPTLTWYDIDTHSEMHIDGNVHGSYFESGTGTYEDPFEIARPIQLYYLSWLQEMGYFNEVETDDEGNAITPLTLKRQYHFYLSQDIDMNVSYSDGSTKQYELPPIGTTKYPFVGSFDGNGHTISNLIITNDVSNYVDDPYTARGVSANSYEILGLFGVLGTTNFGTASNTVNCSYISTAGDISVMDNDAIFNPDTNYIKDFYIHDATIVASTDSDHALVGAVAGFANAKISGVGVYSATLSFTDTSDAVGTSLVGTENINVLSKYTSVGYASEGYKRNISINDGDIYSPTARQTQYVSNSAGAAWGASIDMKTLQNRISKSQNLGYNNTVSSNRDIVPNYPIRETNVTNATGQTTTQTTTNNRPATYWNGSKVGNNNTYYIGDSTVSGKASDQTIGSYYFVNQSGGSRCYLGGQTDLGCSSAKNVTNITETNTDEECYYIKDVSNTNNYAGINNNGEYTATTQGNASKWHYDSTKKCLYTRKTANGHDTVYFLNYLNNNFTVDRVSTTEWTKNASNFAGTSKYKYAIKSGTNYLSTNGTSVSNSSSAVYWNIEGFGESNTGYLSLTVNGELYYLNGTQGDGLGVKTAPNSPWKRNSTSNTSNVQFTGENRTIRYNRSWTTGSATNLTLTKDSTTPGKTASFTTVTDKAFSYEIIRAKTSGTASYVPLTTVGDSQGYSTYDSNNNVSKYYTSSLNTGYLIGGFYDKYNGSTSTSKQLNGNNFGDVRVSKYKRIMVEQSWKSDSFQTLYTIDDSCYNDNGTEKSTPAVIGNNNTFVKFNAAKTNLDKTLKSDTSDVSGIHFMPASINSENIITADKVMINNIEMSNYQMPEDSIDFNLKEKGYINFFAGNYHQDNNSFFALHKIERNNTLDTNGNVTKSEIVSMDKILLIFKNTENKTADYIYLLEDDNGNLSWSDGANRSTATSTRKNNFTKDGETYSCVFDTKWIGVNSTLIPHRGSSVSETAGKDLDYKRLYYFEIPVNDGEYALGSCEGGCGGYLVYLDISAAAQTIQRKEVNEMFTKESVKAEIPNGIQYVGNIPDPVAVEETIDDVRDMSSINDLDTYVGSISTTANGDITISRSGTNISATNNSALTSNYVGDGLTLNNSAFNNRTRTVIRRITDYDYNTATGAYITQVSEIETTGTHNVVRTNISYNLTGFDQTNTSVVTFSFEWDGSEPFYAYSYYLVIFTGGGKVEINISQKQTDDMVVTIEELAPGFSLTCGTNETVIDEDSFTGEDSPTLEILKITDTNIEVTPDTYVAFADSSIISHYHYILENDATMEENFSFSGYGSLQAVDSDKFNTEGYTTITITNPTYTLEFVLDGASPIPSGSNPFNVLYEVKGNTVTITFTDGDGQTITFVQQPNGTYIAQS